MNPAPRNSNGAALPGTPLGEAARSLDLCVHCGFCLQACPTYLALEDENDSPRGRIMLMRAAVDGKIGTDDPALGVHIDRCLGCRACETACPSGVPYGHLLEATRATLARSRPIGRLTATLLAVMASSPLRRLVLGAARLARHLRLTRLLAHLPGRAGFAAAMVESTRPALDPGPEPQAGDGRSGTVAMLDGCVMSELFRHTNLATSRVLARAGFKAVAAEAQGCCGALHAHAGDLGGAMRLARLNIEAFESAGAEFVVVNAAGCGAMMKEYGQLLQSDPAWAGRAAAFSARVRDVTELAAQAPPPGLGELPLHVTYDAPCHLVHAQRIAEQPLAVLRMIPGLSLTPLPDADRCCGGAGIYNLTQPATSDLVLAEKLDRVRETGAVLVATGNPGCHMQIGAGLLRKGVDARCVHPVELLDSAAGRAGPA